MNEWTQPVRIAHQAHHLRCNYYRGLTLHSAPIHSRVNLLPLLDYTAHLIFFCSFCDYYGATCRATTRYYKLIQRLSRASHRFNA